jgi:hypothetical protein
MNAYEIHAPNNFAFYIKYCNGDFKPPVEHSGLDAPKVFYEKIKEGALHIAKVYYDKVISMLPLIGNEKIEFETKKECHICESPFDALPPMLEKKILIIKDAIHYYKSLNDEQSVNKYLKSLEELKRTIKINARKVADHDNLTGKFQGGAHNICNLNYQSPRFLSIFFHNLAGYDAHLFIKQFGGDSSDIKIILNTEEKYISFSKILKYDSGKVNDRESQL